MMQVNATGIHLRCAALSKPGHGVISIEGFKCQKFA